MTSLQIYCRDISVTIWRFYEPEYTVVAFFKLTVHNVPVLAPVFAPSCNNVLTPDTRKRRCPTDWLSCHPLSTYEVRACVATSI